MMPQVHPAARSAATTLLAVLATPPTTTGARTFGRVRMARKILAYDYVVIVNLMAGATRSTRDIAAVGSEEAPWRAARASIEGAFGSADGVLLGYGVAEPCGPARYHFREQVAWLTEQIQVHGLTTHTVGGTPRHPSRWQRWTHSKCPDLAFEQALRESFVTVAPPSQQRRT